MRHEARASSASQKPKIEQELFRRTMGAFATGVTLVTVEAGGAPHAMTANAFMSGSLEPPLCVISIAKRAHTHDMIRQASRFGINILGADQEDLALFFAGKKSLDVEARFRRVADTPLLQDCAARIAASLVNECDCGDHTLFLGVILHMDVSDRPPLIYHRSAFGALATRTGERVPVPEFW
jgi:flavin reductase (DIM6/NTAB) family NADH-FMN oxidoreductase RutF